MSRSKSRSNSRSRRRRRSESSNDSPRRRRRSKVNLWCFKFVVKQTYFSRILDQEVGHHEEADLEVAIDVAIDHDLFLQQNTRSNVILAIVKIHQDRDASESSIWGEELLKTNLEEFLSDMENLR